MTMSKTRLWIAGTAALCVVMVLASWFLLIAPKRAEAADLRQQTADTATSNDTLAARVEELKAQFAQLPQRKAELAEIQRAMPQDPALATLTRDLERLAGESGVTLMSIAPGVPAPVLPAAAPLPAAGTDPAAAAPVPAASTGLSQMSVALQVVGPFAKSTVFLEQVQTTLDRAFLVDGLNVLAEKPAEATGGKPAVGNGDVTFTITGRVFVLDTEAIAAAPITETAPAPSTGTSDS
jgi:type IV pilus assembly protein PilO